MQVDRRKLVIAAIAVLALFAALSPGRHAEIKILAQDPADPAPHQMQAVVDIGLLAISILVTWTSAQLVR